MVQRPVDQNDGYYFLFDIGETRIGNCKTFFFRRGKMERHTILTGPRQWWSLSGRLWRGCFHLMAGETPGLEASSALWRKYCVHCSLWPLGVSSLLLFPIDMSTGHLALSLCLQTFTVSFSFFLEGLLMGLKFRVQACSFFGNLSRLLCLCSLSSMC